jgi:hypothetical protein
MGYWGLIPELDVTNIAEARTTVFTYLNRPEGMTRGQYNVPAGTQTITIKSVAANYAYVLHRIMGAIEPANNSHTVYWKLENDAGSHPAWNSDGWGYDDFNQRYGAANGNQVRLTQYNVNGWCSLEVLFPQGLLSPADKDLVIVIGNGTGIQQDMWFEWFGTRGGY